MKLAHFAIAALLGASSAAAQPQSTIPGNFKKVAVCVYRALDPMAPGSFRMTDLIDSVEITFETHGGGITVRAMKATFSKVSENVTALEIEGKSPGYYPSKVRPLAEECAGKRSNLAPAERQSSADAAT